MYTDARFVKKIYDYFQQKERAKREKTCEVSNLLYRRKC